MQQLFFRDRFRQLLLCLPLMSVIAGCGDDRAVVRQIQASRQERLQSATEQDHLGEAFSLLQRFVLLNREKAEQQVRYHANQWLQTSPARESLDGKPVELATGLVGWIPAEALQQQISGDEFLSTDVRHLRNAYLFRQVVRWVDLPAHDDPLLSDWFAGMQSELEEENLADLMTASRLFDWTIRNVTLEPDVSEPGMPPGVTAPPGMSLPPGMQFAGPGYRQSDFETIWRGTGDYLQRAGVFDQLCRQAGLRSAILAVQPEPDQPPQPWAVGVLIAGEVYLFEPKLGLPIPGPDQTGIATLSQARRDASVMRRLNVPGFFDYPFSRLDIQQSIALLNMMPEGMAQRMRLLQQSLTGDRRMTLYVDVDAVAKQWDDVSGIAGVRLWAVPLQAEIYRAVLQQYADRDPIFGFTYQSRWAFMDAEIEMSQKLSEGRWEHLHGRFDANDDEMAEGARTLYMTQRAPEFEIADLRIDVDLQKAYGIRRELGVDPQTYDQQVRQLQQLMRMGKRTATYWLSMIHFDDQRMDTARNWYERRVLDDNQISPWIDSARYGLARTWEADGKIDQAVELYRTSNIPQEHGNRIRARLLTRESDQ